MTTVEHERAAGATEEWFLRHGLPFFVEGRRISVDDLAHGRSVLVLGLVYAAYRDQFFQEITRELERAVGVRAAYLALRRTA